MAMMGLDDLNITVGADRPGRQLQQFQAKIDADAHIRREDDGDPVRRGPQPFMIFRAEAGGADDHVDIRGRALLDIGRDPGGQAEVDHDIDRAGQRRNINADRHAKAADAGQLTGVPPQGGRGGVLNRRGRQNARCLGRKRQDGFAHPARRAANSDSECH